MSQITQVILYTGSDGRARFREDLLPLDSSNPMVKLSAISSASGLQWRHSPVGFQSEVHVSSEPQWVFVLSGIMEIGLLDGSSRQFGPGEHFYSGDTLPENTTFDSGIHGHRSRQVGEEPLVTLFVKEARTDKSEPR